MNDKELDIIGHSLGINVYHAKRSKKKKDKKLPKEFYRNYYCAGSSHDDLSELQSRGLMVSWEQFGNTYFAVTESGIKLFREEFKKHVDAIIENNVD